MADPAPAVTWVQLLASNGITGTVVLAALGIGWRWFIVRPQRKAEMAQRKAEVSQRKAEQERDEYKELLKREFLAREKRIAEAETALFGRASVSPREQLDTISMLADSGSAKHREAELQSRMLAERAIGMDATVALEAFAPFVPSPGAKGKLPPGAGKEDYVDHSLDRLSRGHDTPTAFNPEALAEPFPPYRAKQGTRPPR